jgi:hypothetical protein
VVGAADGPSLDLETMTMNRFLTRALGAAAMAVMAAACSSAPAPQPQAEPAGPMAQRGPGGPGMGGGGGRMGMMRNPVQALVDSAQSLGLSADQVRQLSDIARQLDEQNRTPLDSLQAHRGEMGGMRMGGGGGEMTPEQRATMERLRPFMMQVRDNNRQALDRAMAVLTADQQARARAMMPQRGMGRGGPGGPPQP